MAFKIKTITLMTFSILSANYLYAEQATVVNLSQVYDKALQSSPEYKANIYTMESKKLGEHISLGAFLPTFGVSGIGQYNHVKDLTFSNTYQNYTAVVGATQVLFDYGLFKTYKASTESSKQAVYINNSQKQQFILDISNSYFNILNYKEQVEFAKANLKSVKSALDEAQQKFAVGMSTSVEVKQAESQYYSAKAELVSSENSLQGAYSQLFTYTGVEYNNLAFLSQDVKYGNPTPNNVDDWIKDGEMNNSYLQSEIAQQDAYKYSLQSTMGSYLPTVSMIANITASYYKGDIDYMVQDGHDPGNTTNSYIGLTFSWNILNGGVDYATRKQAAYNYQASEFDVVNQQRLIKQYVTTDFYSVLSSVKQINALKQSVIAAQSSYEQYKEKFKVGDATMTDVLDQLQKLYQTNSQLASAKYKYIKNMLQLKMDSGNLSEKDVELFNSWLAK